MDIALITGFQDGINPCGMATALVFLIYLSADASTRKRILFFGGLFIAVSFGCNLALALGICDRFLTLVPVLRGTRIFYAALGVVFLYLGALNIIDWRRCQKGLQDGQLLSGLPVFFQKHTGLAQAQGIRKVVEFVNRAFLCFLASSVMVLAGSIYPGSEYIFIVHAHVLSGTGLTHALWPFVAYSGASIAPLLVVWLGVLWMAALAPVQAGVMRYYKGITAALYFSTGSGLLYMVVKVIA